MGSLEKRIAILGLEGQNPDRMTESKKAVLMAVEVAGHLDSLFDKEDPGLDEFKKVVGEINSMKFTSLKDQEKKVAEELVSSGDLRKKLSILSCDINYYTAGVEIYEYSADEKVYRSISEEMRADMLEPGLPSYENAALFSLVREACLSSDFFTQKEQMEIRRKILELSEKDEVYRILFSLDFAGRIRNSFISAIKAKNNLFLNPYLEGASLIFPFLSRRTSVFIDTVIFATEVKDRREAILSFLLEKGFDASIVKLSGKTVLKIDNAYYSLFPRARTVARIPIQGLNLVPYYE